MPVPEAIALWEKSTGIDVPPQSFKWYEAAQQAYILGINARMFKEYFESGAREAGPYFSQFKIIAKLIPSLRRLLDLPTPTVKRPPAP